MSLFNSKKKNYKWPPLHCYFHEIIGVMQDSICIDAPLVEIHFLYRSVPHLIGISSDYTKKEGFFDMEFYFDKIKFETFDDMITYGEQYLPDLFINDNMISILEEKYVGNPRAYTRLEEAEVQL